MSDILLFSSLNKALTSKKSNKLIRSSQNNELTNIMSKLTSLILLLSNDTTDILTFKITDLERFLNTHGGKSRIILKKGMLSLSELKLTIKAESASLFLPWIRGIIYEEETKIFTVELDKRLRKFFNNSTDYTTLNWIYVLPMKNKYSPRLYEILLTHKFRIDLEPILRLQLDEFKDLLGVTKKYKNTNDLKKNVIDSSLKEINKFGTITVKNYIIIKSNNMHYIEFYLINKTADDLQKINDLITENSKIRDIMDSYKNMKIYSTKTTKDEFDNKAENIINNPKLEVENSFIKLSLFDDILEEKMHN